MMLSVRLRQKVQVRVFGNSKTGDNIPPPNKPYWNIIDICGKIALANYYRSSY